MSWPTLVAVSAGRAVRRSEGAGRCRHRGCARGDPRPVTSDPREPRAGVRGAPGGRVGRGGDRPPRVRGRASGREPRDGGPGSAHRWSRVATVRGSGCWPSTTPCPAWDMAAATTRWRRRASAPRSGWPPCGTHGRARSSSSGTPAEERGSGKAIMIEDGLFEGLDAALLYHPCDRNHVETAPLASEDVSVVFTGLQSHAAAEPWAGRNALDAMIALFVSVGLWRQQLPTHCRVHGIIQEGGTAANIIPDRTRAWFMIRSADQPYYEVMKARFQRAVPGRRHGRGRRGRGRVLRRGDDHEAQPDARRALGRQRRGLRDRRRGSGPVLGIDRHGERVVGRCRRSIPSLRSRTCRHPGHSIEFRDAAARPRADRTVLLAATLVAQTAIDLLADPELVAAPGASSAARGSSLGPRESRRNHRPG